MSGVRAHGPSFPQPPEPTPGTNTDPWASARSLCENRSRGERTGRAGGRPAGPRPFRPLLSRKLSHPECTLSAVYSRKHPDRDRDRDRDRNEHVLSELEAEAPVPPHDQPGAVRPTEPAGPELGIRPQASQTTCRMCDICHRRPPLAASTPRPAPEAAGRAPGAGSLLRPADGPPDSRPQPWVSGRRGWQQPVGPRPGPPGARREAGGQAKGAGQRLLAT